LERSNVCLAPQVACATGIWASSGDRVSLSVTEIAEKPTVDEARSRFALPALGADVRLTAFGMYVVSPSIWPILDRMVRHGLREPSHGTFCFTIALDELRCAEGLSGAVIEGERFALDDPAQYARALTAFVTTTAQ